MSLNRYTYVHNDPINYVDRDGLLDTCGWEYLIEGELVNTCTGEVISTGGGTTGGGGGGRKGDGTPPPDVVYEETTGGLPPCVSNYLQSYFPDLNLSQITVFSGWLPAVPPEGGTHAITFGSSIFFAKGDYKFDDIGIALIAHEL